MSTLTKLLFSSLVVATVGCSSDYKISKYVEPAEPGVTAPEIEVDDILDLDESTYKNLMLFSRKVAKSIKKVIECKKVSITVIGLEVPHVHVHLIPLNTMIDANFSNKVKLSDLDFRETAKLISTSFNSL